jgi:hypothetical protein
MMKITKLTIGKEIRYPNSHGDVWTATWADDDNVYVIADDAHGFDRSCNSNLSVHRLTGKLPPDLKAATVNRMQAFGHGGEFKPEDNCMWKACGLICVDGVLYMSVSRHSHPMLHQFFVQECWDSSIVKSTDHGRTWSRTPRIGHAMFPGTTFATPMFLEYGKNGKRGPHGADRFVYAVSSNGVWNNGSSMIMGRVPRTRIGRLDPRDWEFIHGFDEQGEPVWRGRHDTARYIHRGPGKTSMAGIHYLAPLRTYLMLQWHFTKLDHPKLRWKRTRLEFYASDKPWGPWSLVHAQTFSQAWYNPCIPSKFISRDGRDFWMFAAGDFTNNLHLDRAGHFDSYYGLFMIPVRVEI